MNENLAGKVALVTGGNHGIGRAIAYQLAVCGARVAINYVEDASAAEALARQLTDLGGDSVAIRADVSSVSDIQFMMNTVVDKFGTIDILINNAAIDPAEEFFSVNEDFWDRVLDTNLKSVFFCAQKAAQYMVGRGGKIVNISSVHARASMHNFSAYAASKGGINALTRQLALDLAPFHINVNAVAPGVIEVEKYEHFGWYDREVAGKQIPWGRVGVPMDVAGLVTFLSTRNADFVTGQVFTVDGGSSTRFCFEERSMD